MRQEGRKCGGIMSKQTLYILQSGHHRFATNFHLYIYILLRISKNFILSYKPNQSIKSRYYIVARICSVTKQASNYY